jgi:pyruvate,water dikinase
MNQAQTHTQTQTQTTPRFFSQDQAVFLNPDLLGGKAANLAWLTREGFPVPRWWVATTGAFHDILVFNDLTAWVDQQIDHIGSGDDLKLLEKIATDIGDRIRNAELPASLIEQIAEALVGQEQTFFAVRSSVLGEDAQGASFAGQMDSYLFQRGLDAICESLLQVAASAFNGRALQYRVSKGIPLSDIQAAVIVQEMVEGEVSGVMFTAHPGNGSRRHALISGAWGTGEGIVAGLCNTDEFTVGLFDNQIEETLADKDLAVVFDRDNNRGTLEQPVPDSQRHIACLSETQTIELKDLGLRIAQLRREPQDIEWTLRDDQFHILQTRPVTRLPAPNPASCSTPGRRLVFDNSNIQESYCGVTTPLTFSFANRAYAKVYEQTMRVLGISTSEIERHRDMLDNMLGLINGRVYYNINNWYRGLLMLPSFNSNKADMERMMGLTDPVDLVTDTRATTGEKLRKLPQILRALFHLLRGFRRMDTLVADFRAMFDRTYQSIRRDQLHTLTPGELIAEARRLDAELLDRWTSPILNDFYVMMMNGRVHGALVAAGFEQPSVLQNNLLSGEEGIESTEPTKVLLELCAIVRKSPDLRRLLETPADGKNASQGDLLGQIQVLDPGFHLRCLDYIERYGDRTMGELKLESVTLRQDPSFLFSILRNYLTRDDLTPETLAANEARFRAEAEEEAFTTIKEKLGRRALRRFRKHLDKLRDAIRNRENMRLARTRMFGLYRELFLELGKQLAFHDALDQPRDIFWLSLEEIYAWNDGRAVQARLKPLVACRREEYADYEGDEPPHHFWTWDVVYLQNQFAYPHEVVTQGDGDGDLQGTGCYPGIVDNKVRLIFSPEDELSLDGQILCTVRTDPGWAPLFPTAGGIIVERGSTLSHSAVVARELGIPAIIGIPGLTKILADGERVRMDGARGTVERFKKAEEADSHDQ